MDDVKYDACRILAKCYKANGQDELIRPVLERIPEIYFTKLELMALLLDGEDRYEAAHRQKNLSAESLIDMLMILGKHLKEAGETEKADTQLRIALKVIDAFEEDFLETKYFNERIYDCKEKREEIRRLLER